MCRKSPRRFKPSPSKTGKSWLPKYVGCVVLLMALSLGAMVSDAH